MSWFKLDIPQMGQSSTLVPESSLLPGLTPKNVSISIPAPSWKTGLKALVWYLHPHQWHGVEIRLNNIPLFPSVEKSPLMERDAHVLFFLHLPLFSC